jgi:hypothetical protein
MRPRRTFLLPWTCQCAYRDACTRLGISLNEPPKSTLHVIRESLRGILNPTLHLGRKARIRKVLRLPFRLFFNEFVAPAGRTHT